MSPYSNFIMFVAKKGIPKKPSIDSPTNPTKCSLMTPFTKKTWIAWHLSSTKTTSATVPQASQGLTAPRSPKLTSSATSMSRTPLCTKGVKNRTPKNTYSRFTGLTPVKRMTLARKCSLNISYNAKMWIKKGLWRRVTGERPLDILTGIFTSL